MASSCTDLDLASAQNEIILNPRWPKEAYQALHDLVHQVQHENSFHGHVWIATSGSTAESVATTKLAALSKAALQSSACAVNEHLRVTSQDVWTQVLPHFHVGGLGVEVRAQLSQSKVVSALRDGRWDVEYFYTALRAENCTLSSLVPTQVYDLVQAGYKAPPKLRAVVVGGGAFAEDLYLRARALGWPVLPSYGMTETCSQIATASLDSLAQREFPEMKVLGHAEAQTNLEGYLQIKTTALFTGYAQNTPAGGRYWDPKIGGWFTTEDQGKVVRGAICIHGRSKDYIKIGGEATSLARLRAILELVTSGLGKEWTSKVTLLDSPSERLGSEIHLVSQLAPEETLLVEKAYVEKVLPFERPRKIHQVSEIPRGALGKILWGELRKRL